MRPEDVAQQQVLHYRDENPGDMIDFNPIADNTFYNAYKPNADLAEFLSRPVVISTQTWLEGSNTFFFVEPWLAFFNNDAIKRKLDNYYLISCNLRIKVMINASNFYYGFALLSYEPMTNFQPAQITNLNADQELIGLSQRPHLYIYPQCNQGGEMSLPFFYHKDWLNATSATDLANMGRLDFRTFTPLLNANSIAGTDVNVQIIAYAEDVRVCGPTYTMSVQAGDEYSENGVISKPASAIAKATGILSDLPIIGPMMLATSSVASKVGTVASWFGWTNVPVIDDVKPFKDLPFHSFSSSEIGQPIEKLTLDPKNELTVDPRVSGLDGKDELEIKSIVMRESYLTQFGWTSADTAGTNLFTMNITPQLYNSQSIDATSSLAIQATPIDHISRLFRYWHGDIVVRFRFICSNYHRGRAIIIWDPLNTGTAGNAFEFMSTNYNRIVDITTEPDVEVRVPYMQLTSWLENRQVYDRTEYSENAANVSTPNNRFENGQLSVWVYTSQTSPVASADIRVMVSVRAADNIEFATPAALNQNLSQFLPLYDMQVQSGTEMIDDVEELNIAGVNAKDNPDLNLVYMGETILSLRQLLRRTTMVRAIAHNGTDNAFMTIFNSLQGRYPYMYGYASNGFQQANTLNGGQIRPFNWNKVIPFTHVANMFVGMRGSMNWHFNCDSDDTARTLSCVRHIEQRTAFADNYITTVGVDSTDRLNRNITLSMLDGAEGMSLLNQETQTGMSIQTPYYSRYRFTSTSPYFANTGNEDVDDGEDSLFVQSTHHPKTGGVQDGILTSYASIGTDFNFLFFLGVPTFFLYENVPNAP